MAKGGTTSIASPAAVRPPLDQRLIDELFRPVDAASLVIFRICFGVIMIVEVGRFWDYGWIHKYYIRPDFLFKYYGFGWVEPWSGSGMYWHFIVLALLGLLIALGACYRLAALLFFFAFSYVFLLDQARYLNHFYLVILVAFLMVLVPAHRSWSVDAALFGRNRWRKGWRGGTVPNWSVWLFRLQFEVVYIFAGLVKVNPDWLRLEPMGMWLARRADFEVIGPYLTEDWVVALAAYGAIILHLVGAPLLLIRRTRLYVMAVYMAFHLSNHFLFQIGIFPWFTIAGTLMFLDPDWPQQTVRWCRKQARRGVPAASGGAGRGTADV